MIATPPLFVRYRYGEIHAQTKTSLSGTTRKRDVLPTGMFTL